MLSGSSTPTRSAARERLGDWSGRSWSNLISLALGCEVRCCRVKKFESDFPMSCRYLLAPLAFGVPAAISTHENLQHHATISDSMVHGQFSRDGLRHGFRVAGVSIGQTTASACRSGSVGR